MRAVKSFIEEQQSWSFASAEAMVGRVLGWLGDRHYLDCRLVFDLADVPDNATVWLVSRGSITAQVCEGNDRVASWTVTSGTWLDRLYVGDDGSLRKFGQSHSVVAPGYVLILHDHD
jgi:hypothetical protein